MKALTLAVVLLSSAAALAQTAPTKAADSVNIAGGAEFRRPPPPGHSTPHPMPQPVPQRNQIVVDREQMERRIDRLEKALRDAMSRTRDAKGRDSIRNAMEELDKLSEYVDDAAPLPPVVINQPAPMPPPPPVVRPISDQQFRSITQAMVRESFPREKLRILSQVAPNENFLVSHILSVLGQFSFSNDKLEVVRLMRPTLLDPQNGYQLYQAFPFSNDKAQLQAILESGGRY
ncbi:DUF4476 domain-containing protein [Corallococcus sp. AS-1-6]|uniref:DUF4476 domain-containing protein n=1 Tax=Corallococcus sp. AS-1-6 TaxID=2874599 RepID=UPI001CC0758F|nr:DUF4476 domain-containing protein [Corallococcus sp. AS-1-6]MBZ4375544.1 DUF4476 domain-containing protein [Corallococcus sp. AS-1-6]